MNICRNCLLCSGFLISILTLRLAAAPGSKPDGKFQDLRTNCHDRQQENTSGNPSSEQEKSELPSPVLITPWSNHQDKPPSGDETNMEKPSWKCAYI
jgi:hypothetical protein